LGREPVLESRCGGGSALRVLQTAVMLEARQGRELE
jgi:hypothetical protein